MDRLCKCIRIDRKRMLHSASKLIHRLRHCGRHARRDLRHDLLQRFLHIRTDFFHHIIHGIFNADSQLLRHLCHDIRKFCLNCLCDRFCVSIHHTLHIRPHCLRKLLLYL